MIRKDLLHAVQKSSRVWGANMLRFCPQPGFRFGLSLVAGSPRRWGETSRLRAGPCVSIASSCDGKHDPPAEHPEGAS